MCYRNWCSYLNEIGGLSRTCYSWKGRGPRRLPRCNSSSCAQDPAFTGCLGQLSSSSPLKPTVQSTGACAVQAGHPLMTDCAKGQPLFSDFYKVLSCCFCASLPGCKLLLKEHHILLPSTLLQPPKAPTGRWRSVKVCLTNEGGN